MRALNIDMEKITITKPLNQNSMKNIHLLPTEKPSRIRLGNNKNFVIANFEQSSIRSKNDSYTNQHIYITFDEEIKVGEYVIDLENNEVFISLGKMGVNNYIKKIILTTDQDLIASGVQAIDDEFLEWFVKNPTREFVMTLPDVRGLRDIFQPTEKDLYKIIIGRGLSQQNINQLNNK